MSADKITPEQLREQANDSAWCLPDSGRYAEECRHHAAALDENAALREQLARLKAPVEVAGIVGELGACELATTRGYSSTFYHGKILVPDHLLNRLQFAIESQAAQLAERDAEIRNLRLHLSDKNQTIEAMGATRVKLEADKQ